MAALDLDACVRMITHELDRPDDEKVAGPTTSGTSGSSGHFVPSRRPVTPSDSASRHASTNGFRFSSPHSRGTSAPSPSYRTVMRRSRSWSRCCRVQRSPTRRSEPGSTSRRVDRRRRPLRSSRWPRPPRTTIADAPRESGRRRDSRQRQAPSTPTCSTGCVTRCHRTFASNSRRWPTGSERIPSGPADCGHEVHTNARSDDRRATRGEHDDAVEVDATRTGRTRGTSAPDDVPSGPHYHFPVSAAAGHPLRHARSNKASR